MQQLQRCTYLDDDNQCPCFENIELRLTMIDYFLAVNQHTVRHQTLCSFLQLLFPLIGLTMAESPYRHLVDLWDTHAGIDEIGFVHESTLAVFEETKLAVPYSLLASLASTACEIFYEALSHEKPQSSGLASSLALLTVNGNNYQAWNYRKAALTEASTGVLKQELQINAALLSKHSKSACGWSHR